MICQLLPIWPDQLYLTHLECKLKQYMSYLTHCHKNDDMYTTTSSIVYLPFSNVQKSYIEQTSQLTVY